MRKSLVALLFALVMVLVSCLPHEEPTSQDAQWDSSQWDSTAVWK
jgi:hypothetical protein